MRVQPCPETPQHSFAYQSLVSTTLIRSVVTSNTARRVPPVFGERGGDRGPTSNIGPTTATVAMALLVGAIWLCVKHPRVAVKCVIAAALVAVVTGGGNVLAHPLVGLLVMGIGAAIGWRSGRGGR